MSNELSMSPKEFFFDFLNWAFLVLLVSFVIIYFIGGDRFDRFRAFLEAVWPLAFFGIIFLIGVKLSRRERAQRIKESSSDIVIYISPTVKLFTDIIVFALPIIMLLVILAGRKNLDKIDVLAAGLIFLTVFAWQKYLLSRS